MNTNFIYLIISMAGCVGSYFLAPWNTELMIPYFLERIVLNLAMGVCLLLLFVATLDFFGCYRNTNA